MYESIYEILCMRMCGYRNVKKKQMRPCGESGGIYQSFVVYGCHNGWDSYLSGGKRKHNFTSSNRILFLQAARKALGIKENDALSESLLPCLQPLPVPISKTSCASDFEECLQTQYWCMFFSSYHSLLPSSATLSLVWFS